MVAVTLVSSSAIAAAPDARSLAEVNRFLEEEIKLAGRPQVYLVLDPFDRVIVVKSRGVELHRFPVLGWRSRDGETFTGVFKLLARPRVSRPKSAPAEDQEPPAIGLDDMPEGYELVFDPPLTIAIAPPARERPGTWMMSLVREWWDRLLTPLRVWDENRFRRRLRLTLSEESARSLAWSVTEKMPLLIGRSRVP